MDLYEILEIKPNASKIEIRKAYYSLAKKYHPDKLNSSESDDKFKRINSAYEILINDESRVEYLKLNHQDKYNFSTLFDRIIHNKLNIGDFIKYGINISNIDLDYIKKNFMNFFKNLNIKELLDLYTNGKIIKKDLSDPMDCSDTDENLYTETCAEYYHTLPIGLEMNSLDININLNIKLGDIVDTKKKIIIKRKIDDSTISSTFIFNLSNPYIIYYGGGDICNEKPGNLIIKLNLPHNYYWDDNIILIEQSMTLYEMIYGLDIEINLNSDTINIPDWVPSRDGLFIDLTKYEFKINNYNIAIKLYLDYNTTDEKELLLKKYFS